MEEALLVISTKIFQWFDPAFEEFINRKLIPTVKSELKLWH
jgi:hypothetical protein